MADKKGKSRAGGSNSGNKDRENKKRKSFGSNKKDGANKKVWRGPRLPNAFQKELDPVKRVPSEGDEEFDFDGEAGDLYEYEEDIPEEESKKNKRFDPVENFQYELPEDFEDENVASDDEDDDNDEDEDDDRHARMLEEITGLPKDAFEGKKKKDLVVSEESELNPNRDILSGNGKISIQDLLNPLQGKAGFAKLRKNLLRMETKSKPITAPLPKTDQERIERKAAYEHSKKDITKWELLVKKNREAPTLYFDENVDLGYSTIGAIASEFKPRTDLEMKIASLVNHSEVIDAHNKDGARILELNKVSIEDEKERQERLAKMRGLLFRHELKAKRIKKIKSKTYHRLMKKDRMKAAEATIQMDPEAAKELAMKQEFKRAEERMTLKHKNSSKWANRILKRGLDVQDDGTRLAFAEQLNQHAALTRKMNSIKENSSDSDDSSNEDDSDDAMSADSEQEDRTSKLLIKAKEKTRKVLEEDDELPASGVLSLPFMVRGLKKRKEAADEEAKLALDEYDSSLNQLEDKTVLKRCEKDASSGRRIFGVSTKVVPETSKKVAKSENNNYYGNSDSDNDGEAKEDDVIEHETSNQLLKEADIDPNLLREEFEMNHDSVFKSFKGVEDPEPKTNIDVAFFASDSWKKMKKPSDGNNKQTDVSNDNVGKSSLNMEKEEDDDGDTDSDAEMVDGILSSVAKSTYELPTQEELIHRAFAGDDVEEDFEKDKEDVLNEENPLPEKPVLLPGWGQWTHIQKKQGLPSWMVEEHELAKKKREEALKKRKDAKFNSVIISEKVDKKAEKLHTKTLPYPYTSKEVFEQSIRMPIGPEFNPVSSVGAMNRPEVVKKSGLIIKPIKFRDTNGRERSETHKGNGQKQKKSGGKNGPMKKKTAKV